MPPGRRWWSPGTTGSRSARAGGACSRSFPADILTVDHRFYADLGVDLDALGVVYDIKTRPNKSPLAYTDFLQRGRYLPNGEWTKTIARVVGRYEDGGLSSLNELVHENGHAVHISAIRNRPAYTDWTDTLFTEAFADVPSWSVYEPAWQRKYLGTEIPVGMSLKGLHGSVMMDIAWSLFEIRMLRDPAQDPNALWTDITREYLHIKPHPEVAWWAVRVQLVSRPGYMVNYGLGSILTAEIRKATSDAIGPFDAGNPTLARVDQRQAHPLRLREERQAADGRAPRPAAVARGLARRDSTHKRGRTPLMRAALPVVLVLLFTIGNSHASDYPRIDFEPESRRFESATEQYREIWRTEGERISAALEKATGLHMEPGPIRAIVFEGISNSGYKRYPMYMRASYPPDTKRATLVHELSHRLISDRVSKDFEDHPVIFLFVYDVWVALWGQDFADAQVAVESDRTGHYDYRGAWRDALALGRRGSGGSLAGFPRRPPAALKRGRSPIFGEMGD